MSDDAGSSSMVRFVGVSHCFWIDFDGRCNWVLRNCGQLAHKADYDYCSTENRS